MEIKKGTLVYSEEIYYLYRREKNEGPISEGVGIVVAELDAEWVKVYRAEKKNKYEPIMRREDLVPLVQLSEEELEKFDAPWDAFWFYLPEILMALVPKLQELSRVFKNPEDSEKLRRCLTLHEVIKIVGKTSQKIDKLNQAIEGTLGKKLKI